MVQKEPPRGGTPADCALVSQPVKLRLFLDSNVLLGEIVAEWGLDKAVLSLCAAKIVRLVLAEAVRDEIEENLLIHAQRLPGPAGDKLIENYRRLIDLTGPEIVPYPDSAAVRSAWNMIRMKPMFRCFFLQSRHSRTGC